MKHENRKERKSKKKNGQKQKRTEITIGKNKRRKTGKEQKFINTLTQKRKKLQKKSKG